MHARKPILLLDVALVILGNIQVPLVTLGFCDTSRVLFVCPTLEALAAVHAVDIPAVATLV